MTARRDAHRDFTYRWWPGTGRRGRRGLDHLVDGGHCSAVGRQRRRFHAAPHRRAGTLDVFQHLVAYERGQGVHANARAVLAVRRTGDGVQQTCVRRKPRLNHKLMNIIINTYYNQYQNKCLHIKAQNPDDKLQWCRTKLYLESNGIQQASTTLPPHHTTNQYIH